MEPRDRVSTDRSTAFGGGGGYIVSCQGVRAGSQRLTPSVNYERFLNPKILVSRPARKEAAISPTKIRAV